MYCPLKYGKGIPRYQSGDREGKLTKLISTVKAFHITGMLVIMMSQLLMIPSIRAQDMGQSPIDIRTEDLTEVDQLPTLKFHYDAHVTLDVTNTGSPNEHATVLVKIPPESGLLQVAGVGYQLSQFHWHTPSEHLIEGESFPIEMHLVHQAADGNLLVVAILITRGKKHKELAKIFAHFPNKGNTIGVQDFNLSKLLPGSSESFRYTGSLTTPPFTGGLKWVVLEEPVEMSKRQIKTFMKLFPEGNSRQVQPLNERTIRTDTDSLVEKN